MSKHTGNKNINILILEDNLSDVDLILAELHRYGYAPNVRVLCTKEEYLSALNELPDLILSDYTMPQFDAPHALALLQERSLDIPFIVISGTIGEDAAVAIMRAGAADYLLKDRLSRLGVSIENALQMKELRRQKALTAETLKKMLRAVEQSADSIVITDSNGVIEYVNPGFTRITGYAEDEVIRKTPAILKSGKHDEKFYSLLWKTIKDGNVFRAEFVNRKKNGELYTEVQAISPVFDERGNIINFVSTGKDITERKRAEEAILRSGQQYRTLIEAMNEGVLQVDNDDVIMFANDQYCKMVGYSREELVGNVAHEMMLLEEDRYFIKGKNRIRTAGVADSYEIRMKTKSGEIRWFKISGAPIYDLEGKVIGSIGVHSDITEQKKAIESLKLFRALVDHANDAIEVIDPLTGRFIDMNERACLDLGYSREEMLNMSVFDIDPNIRKEYFAGDRAAGITVIETVHTRKDGSVFPVEVTLNYIQLDKEYIVAIVRDITERKQIERRNELISDLGYRLSSVEQSEEAARIVVEVADQLFGWDACTVDLYSAENDMLSTVLIMDIVGGERRPVKPTASSAVPTPTIRKALTEGAVLILCDQTEVDPPSTRMFGDTTRRSASLMFVPIRYGGKAIGIISIQSYTHKKYNHNDIVMLQGMADQCGAAFIRIRTAEALRKSESSLRRAQQVGKTGSWYVDLKKNTLEWSDEVFRIFGRDPATFKPSNEHFFSIVHPDDRDTVQAASANAIRTGERYAIEHRIVLPDGSVKDVAEQAEIVRDESGKSLLMLGVVQDITERKKEERKDLLISRLGYRLSSAETSEQAAEIVVDTADQLFGWDACTVDIYSSETGTVHTVWSVDEVDGKRTVISPSFLQAPPTERMKKIFKEGALLILREKGQGFESDAIAFGDTSRPSASLMFAPIRHAEKNIGIISIQSYEQNKYSQKDLVTLQGMADQCGAAFMRIRSLEAVKASEEKYRDIFAYAPVGIFQSAVDGTILTVNKALASMLGYASEKELLGKDMGIHVYYRQDDRRRFIEAYEQKGFARDVELLWKKKDGTPAWIQMNWHVVKSTDGGILFYEGFARDITERKKYEDALRLSEERYRTLIDGAVDAIFTVTKEGEFASLNPAFEKITGWRRDQWIGKNFMQLIHPDDRDEVMKNFKLRLEGIEVPVKMYRITTSSGATVTVEILTSPQIIDGVVVGILGVARDVTERLRLEAQFRQVQKMESIGTLAGGIAHDFNNILGIILASATLLERLDPAKEKFKSTLETITRTVHRGAMLVRQILTFARKNDVTISSVQINDIVLELTKMLEMTIPKTIGIKLDLDASLPNINIDSNQVHQALLNLCVNARDAILDRTSKGVQSGTITITSAKVDRSRLKAQYQHLGAEQYVVLRVSDTGIGMDEETKRRIFDPFFTTKEIGKGTGLGLAVVYGVMQSQQGFVDVESTPGQGTSFALYFPISDASQAENHPQPERQIESLGGSETILVIEDEESLTELIKFMLESKGYTVYTAATGAKGVEMFKQHAEKISLVFTDFGLPEMDGFTMLQQIKRVKPDTRMLMASGYLESSQRSEIYQLGVYEIIQKPYEPSMIISKIREILDYKNKR